jgi:hypothetical protein
LILVDMWTPGVPWGDPARPTIDPWVTTVPDLTWISDRYDNETLNPITGSMVTVFMPATDLAKVISPEIGARTGSPTSAA